MSTTGSPLGRGTVVALAAMGAGIFLVANDFTAFSVAIQDIERDLDASLNRAQWVINAYTLVFGVLIVTGGRLADLYGRRRVFVIGAATFAVFSLLAGLAPTIELLIAARALMGVGGALMWPSVLGMTFALLPEDRAGLAGGFVIGVAGFGNALGPLVAGALTDVGSWRWVFFLNVPVSAAAIWAVTRFVDESETDRTARLDYRGVALLSVGVILVMAALDWGTEAGFADPVVVAMLAVGAVGLVLFALAEARVGEAALLPSSLVANRTFAAGAVATLLMSSTLFGMLLYVPQYTQKALGWSALEAGAGLLPVMLTFALVSFAAGPLYERVGARLTVAAGALCLAVGILWLAAAIGGTYAALVPALVVLGIGIGLFFSGITTASVTAVDPGHSSLAGAIIYMCNISGGAVGLAVNTAIVLGAARFADGIARAFAVDGVLALAGLGIVVALVKGAGTWHPHLPGHQRSAV